MGRGGTTTPSTSGIVSPPWPSRRPGIGTIPSSENFVFRKKNRNFEAGFGLVLVYAARFFMDNSQWCFLMSVPVAAILRYDWASDIKLSIAALQPVVLTNATSASVLDPAGSEIICKVGSGSVLNFWSGSGSSLSLVRKKNLLFTEFR